MKQATTEQRRGEQPTPPAQTQAKLHRWAAGAALQCYASLVLMLAAFKPDMFALPLSQPFAVALCAASLCVGALLVLLAGRLRLSARPLYQGIGLALSLLAALALVLGSVIPGMTGIAYGVALGCTGLSLPALLWKWGAQLGNHPKEELLLNSCAGFLGIDLLLVATHFLPEAQGILVALALIGGCIAGKSTKAADLAHPHRPARPTPANATEPADAGSIEDGESLATLKRFALSVSSLGTLLYLFTLGITAQQANIEIQSLAAFLASAAVAVLILAALAPLRRRLSPNQMLFGLLDIGLPGLAVVAFLIKMVPINAISLTLFPHYMETYFLLLLPAFWMNLLLFASANRTLLPLACGTMGLAAAVALGVGYTITFLGPDTRSVLMGSITAAFLLYAVVAGGHSLILYLKGPENTEEIPPAVAMLDVCEKLGEEHQLTPREREVLGEVAYGHSSSYIAQTLYISNNTARSHLKNIYKKLDVHSREELIELIRSAQATMERAESE